MNHEINTDVAIIGGGVTGLMLSKKLSGLGMHVALVEKEQTFASGPSTRNEGWLHSGTYHAQSIADREAAIQVARRCIYGHEEIRRYVPEAIEDSGTPSYALIRDKNRTEEVVSRWNEADVFYASVLMRQFADIAPEVQLDGVEEVFRVRDVSLDTRILYRKLLTDAMRNGTDVYTSSQVDFKSQDGPVLIDGRAEEKHPLNATLFVHTSGYGMKSFLQDELGIDVPMRYWKSHLHISPKLSPVSVFCLDPHEAAMINHGSFSITGLNEDAVVVDHPDYETIPQNEKNLKDAVGRLFHVSPSLSVQTMACVKVDVASTVGSLRSLSVKIFEPLDGHICTLPGKMTESPYTTDVLTKVIYDRLASTSPISQRPIDMVQF